MPDNSADHQFASAIASLCLTALQSMDDGVSDGQAAACIEACRVVGLATMRQVSRILGNPSDTFLAVQASDAAVAALDGAGLAAEDCPRLSALCAEEWRRAFLCH